MWILTKKSGQQRKSIAHEEWDLPYFREANTG
jgi:hypothetical protein